VKSGLKRFLQNWLISTLAVLAAVLVLPGLHFAEKNLGSPFVTSLALAVLNAMLRPFMLFLTRPLVVFSLGLFMIVLNAGLLYLVQGLVALVGVRFIIDNFWWAMLAAIIMSVISLPLNLLTGGGNIRVTVRRHSRPPDSRPGGDDGPVIDV
jgi:putative membrane protein